MSETTIILLVLAGVAYWQFAQGRLTLLPPAKAETQAPQAGQPGVTRITIPGVGSYINVGGGEQVQVTLDPRLLGMLVPSQPPPQVAMPTPQVDAGQVSYQPLDLAGPSAGSTSWDDFFTA